ncbi:hypothetical protein HHI36_010812 [Cryptolaemus montrouzieri]|uniref:Uncharacterized protein n=1 Tax=Cryptolaemus montrouzieri TaxID=559131 RepID=A0ABD2MJR7_9CUCU
MSFPKSRRFSEAKVEDSPGPADYNVKLNMVKKQAAKFKICTSPRFPENCRRSFRGATNCLKCSNADNASLKCAQHEHNRSLNSSLNSSIDTCKPRRRFATIARSNFSNSRLYGVYQDLSQSRQGFDIKSKDNSFNEDAIDSRGVLMAPTCIHVYDSTDTEDEIELENESTKSTKSYENDSPKEDSGIPSSDHSSDGISTPEPNSRSPSLNETSAFYSDSIPSEEAHCFDLISGQSFEVNLNSIAARKIKELQKRMESHKMEMQKMQELLLQLGHTISTSVSENKEDGNIQNEHET